MPRPIPWVNAEARLDQAVPREDLTKATVVFDLDGTLVDTAPDLTNALNDVLIRRGYAPIPAATVRSAVGLGARAMIEEGLRQVGVAGDIEPMLAEFLQHYDANIAVESRPFPGALASLETLKARGATLAVCTNKREYLARKLLAQLRLDGYFEAIAGRDSFAVAKPHPGHLTETIALAGGEPSRAIMVGDSEVDVLAAKAASIPVIMVSFGYAPVPFDGLSPDAVIDHFDELAPKLPWLLRRPGDTTDNS
jgi:phosphoglycolate phosphatase